MDTGFIFQGKKKLRCGYTTGSCAAAAAKAAAVMLLTGSLPDEVTLMTPKGILLSLEITEPLLKDGSASCAVVKDSGDDPDVTNGIRIFAEVSLSEKGVSIEGGKGIGRVTKQGLDRPVGAAAINSTPLRMITEAVTEAAKEHGYSGGFNVVISAPEGEAIAAKTFNPRLGIEGGISIIGTTGIVEPMSSRAIVDTIRSEASVRRSEGRSSLVLTVGNYSSEYLKLRLPDISGREVICSNFIGEAIDIGVSLCFDRIAVIGHIGKLVKLGSGIMNTHSHEADGRFETLIACAALAGAPNSVLKAIDSCVATDHALALLNSSGYYRETFRILSERVEKYLTARADGISIAALAFSFAHGIVFETTGFGDIIKAISEEAE